MPPNICVNKCVVDDGTAPCTDRGFLSMTVCKPKVRTSAKVGDIVIAFGTNAQRAPNRLVCAGKNADEFVDGEIQQEINGFRAPTSSPSCPLKKLIGGQKSPLVIRTPSAIRVAEGNPFPARTPKNSPQVPSPAEPACGELAEPLFDNLLRSHQL